MSDNQKSKDAKMIPNILHLIGLLCLIVGWTVCFWFLLNKVLTPRLFTICFVAVGIAAYVIARINYVTDLELWGAKIKTAVDEAKTTVHKLAELQKEIDDLISAAKQHEKILRELIEQARPPILLLNTSTFNPKKTGDGIGQRFRLIPDKNVALGRVIIYARIVDNNKSKILRMEFAGSGLTQKTKTFVEPQAKSAWKGFFPPVPIPLDIEIVVSEPCEVILEGTYVIKPNIINVVLPDDNPPEESQQSNP